MSDLLAEMGIEEDQVKWYMLAACNGMPINWFYDNYEQNKTHAAVVDELCLTCPVVTQCLAEGKTNKEIGVWGGIYLNLGKTDKDQNKHKTPEVWKELRKKHGAHNI